MEELYMFLEHIWIHRILTEKILFYKKAIELKRRNFKIEGLDRLLEGIILEFQKINQQAPKDYEQMLNMLRKIKAEFHIDDYTFWQIKPTYEVYLLNEVLKIYRQEKNKAIKEIAQKCCSEKTYRALENGMRMRTMERLQFFLTNWR